LNKPALDALFAAVFAAILGVILAPFWNDFWADMKPALGAPLVALIGILILVGIAAFSLAILHYFGVLGAGAEPVSTRERRDYDALRQRIAAGNWIAREYARKLTIFLNGIDRFFGDQGMADRTLFPRAFGLSKPAPLWTAPAFDRCLLLAIVYPVAAIELIWAVSSHIGPAEMTLGLKVASGWSRAEILLINIFIVIAAWLSLRATGWRSLVWVFVVSALCNAGSLFFKDAIVNVVLVVVGVLGGSYFPRLGLDVGAGTFAVTFAIACTIVHIIAGDLTSLPVAGIVAFIPGAATFAVGLAVAVAVGFAHANSKRHGWQGAFLSLFILVMLVACFAGARSLSPLHRWQSYGPLLLFLGLLTLLNAPFDWLSLGVTRALMRRGLEREKWWPYLYAVFDGLSASVIVALLAMAMVAGVQLFDDLALYGGGKPVFLPMPEFLDAIKAKPGKPEYWWVYATLFSTMLPSLINLFIAGVSLARGVPGVSTWLLVKVREGEAVPAYDRLLVAIALALQGVAGLTIATVAQGFLFWVIIWQGMPRLGISVLDLAYLIAH
jgi:hypothetical protein